MPSSKTRSSQGLGISYSSVEAGTPPKTEEAERARTKASGSHGHSPSRPQRRPTYTRDTTAHNFNSFSAILPPSGASSSRQLPSTPEHHTKRRSNTPGPTRMASTASASTTASQLRKARSADVLRKFGRNSGLEGRPYVPLSETDIDDDPGSVIGAAIMSQTSSRSSGTMENEIRSVQVDVQYMPERSGSVMTGWTRRTEASRLQPSGPSRRPLPVEPTIMEDEDDGARRKRRSTVTQRDYDDSASSRPRLAPIRTDTASSDHTEHEPNPEAMSRSRSTPTGEPSPAKPYFSYPEGLDDPPPAVRPKLDDHRQSSVSTGIHSKNAIILSAESGGLMLEYSDAGVWKEGQKIIGKRTGLVPTPDCTSEVSAVDDDDLPDDHIRRSSRPRADSRVSMHTQSGYLKHSRSRSENDAVLARQGTLFHPASSHDRTSDELGVMLGKSSRKPTKSRLLPPPDNIWDDDAPDGIRIEASKKRKARVEVDIVLERDTVVEGGEVRGRMEVRVYGSKRTEGLRVGAGKIRVVGFEEASDSHRHIFYHHPHPLPQFVVRTSEQIPGISLFASDPDGEGFRLAAEGSHSIPFRLRLPPDGGAKGSYASNSSKGPRVRYVVVGSVKLYLPLTGKRSIAHFYRTFSVLPFLKASTMLAPSREPIEARTENGLGWSMGGDKGRVSLRAALGRGTWISGQKLWCEVGIHNDSSKRIKNLQLAILQTVQTFNPNPLLDPSGRPRSVSKRRSADREALLNQMETVDMDLDACQTSTQQRKVSQEVFESDFASTGAGRVTGKGWWTGVEPGESGHWDLSLAIPPNLISIGRTRLVEVKYNLRVSVSNSIYVDIPIKLIDFLSIDPPPMPGDAPRLPLPQSISTKAKMPRDDSLGLPLHMIHQKGAFYPLNDPSITEDDEESQSPAKESSNTMHLDEAIERGRNSVEKQRERPMSMASDYTEDMTPILPPANEPRRPLPARFTSYLSSPAEESDETGMLSSSADHQSEEADKALSAARRAQGRARSLAALERAAARETANQLYDDKAQASSEDHDSQTEESDYKPLVTPFEEPFKMLGSSEGSSESHATPRATARAELDMSSTVAANDIDDGPGLSDLAKVHHEEDDSVDVGNDTVLETLVRSRHGGEEEDGDWVDESDDEEREPHRSKSTHHPDSPLTPDDPLDADHPIHQAISLGTANPAVDPQLAFMTGEMPHTRDRYASENRSFNGSVATNNTHISDESSEIGQVYEAKKEILDMPSQATIVHSPRNKLSQLDTSLLTVDPDVSGNLLPRSSGDTEPRHSTAAASPFNRRKSKASVHPSPSVTREDESSRSPAKKLSRTRSTRSKLSIVDQPDLEVHDVPELTPSVGSDAGSSEEYVTVESPIMEEPQLRTTTSTRTLPRIPVQSSGPMSDFAGMDSAPAENLWLPAGTLLRNQVERLRGETPESSFRPGSPPPQSADGHSEDASHEGSGSSNSHDTGSTGHTHQSLLPSVKSKIAQLEERQEALRKMSLASFGTPAGTPRPAEAEQLPSKIPVLRSKTSALRSAAAPSPSKPTTRPSRSRTLGADDKPSLPAVDHADVAPKKTADPVSHRSTARTPGLAYREDLDDSEPEVYQVNSELGHGDMDPRSCTPAPISPISPTSPISPRSPPAKTKRKSYTAALAPRPARQISDDTGLQNTNRDVAQRVVVSPTSGHPIVMPSVSEAGHGHPVSPRRSHTPAAPAVASPSRPKTVAPPGRSKTVGERPTSYTPMPRPKSSSGNLRRDKSTSSTSTTATTVEAALMNRKQQLPRRQTRAQTMYVEGKYGTEGGYDYQPYSSSPTYGSPPGVASSAPYGQAQYSTQYNTSYGVGGSGVGYYGGGYGDYHDPYKSLSPGTPGFLRPADRPASIRGVEASEWDKFY